MKETGLMFKAPLVRAILSGQKTQTRRVVKPQPVEDQGMVNAAYCGHPELWLRDGPCDESDPAREWRCPMGKPGDRIYVRETWAYGVHAQASARDEDGPFVYAADGTTQGRLCSRWRPSIHMPKHAARIWLEITGVRAERLQDICEGDADREGVELKDGSDEPYSDTNRDGFRYRNYQSKEGAFDCGSARESFRTLWESTGGDWAANPWTWVIDFKRIDQPAPKEAP